MAQYSNSIESGLELRLGFRAQGFGFRVRFRV